MHAFVYNSKNLHPGYLIIEVHGGGFMYNTAADDDDFCHFIHQTLGIPVISCDYSLTPEHPFPTGLEDVYDWCASCPFYERAQSPAGQNHPLGTQCRS